MVDKVRSKSNEQIIEEQDRDLQEKSLYTAPRTFNPAGETVLERESGVNESGLEDFPKTRGIRQVTVGRTGQTGGGANSQWIPPEEGADENRQWGNPSTDFEGPLEGQ
ncbi:hypothetical protein CERSUDRAFT_116299 [Gelatoporia subvermispora B]|uniref:Uncharacterized protein n=1 Tax=Ceriporiopsis subvermispora (strain B) TaxID=914234 RepID=M2PHL7_CERS8|nr:hypothetical protein CERSUDRAFT_116299 [Gelatoporia subvermispora B]